MHLTEAFDETTATWNAPGAGHDVGGTVGKKLGSAALDTSAAVGTVFSFSGDNWVTAVSNAMNDTSCTLYVLGKRRAEGGSGGYYVQPQNDEDWTLGIDARPGLVVEITVQQ